MIFSPKHSNTMLSLKDRSPTSVSPRSLFTPIKTSSIGNIIIEGVLSKYKSTLFGGWNDHWFRLTPKGLFYYDKPRLPQLGEEITGQIDLSCIKYYRVSKEYNTAIEIMLNFNSQDRLYILNTSNFSERDKWISVLDNWTSRQTLNVQINGNIKPKFKEKLSNIKLSDILESKESNYSAKSSLPVADISSFVPQIELFSKAISSLHTQVIKSATPEQLVLLQHQLYQIMQVPAITSCIIKTSFQPILYDKEQVDIYWKTIDPLYHHILKTLIANNFEIAIELVENSTAFHSLREKSNSLNEVGAATDDRDIIRCIVSAMDVSNNIVPFISTLIEKEVKSTDTEGNLFRANTPCSKVLTTYLKISGKKWLFSVFRSMLDKIYESSTDVEVDPTKIVPRASMSIDATLAINQKKLLDVIDIILSKFFQSLDTAPTLIRQLCFNLQAIVATKFESAKLSSIGGLLFLRFINPAILNPGPYFAKNFNMDGVLRRKLILITKVLQNLANKVKFGNKEEFMIPFNETISKNEAKLESFIESFISVDSIEVSRDYPLNIFEIDFLQIQASIDKLKGLNREESVVKKA